MQVKEISDFDSRFELKVFQLKDGIWAEYQQWSGKNPEKQLST